MIKQPLLSLLIAGGLAGAVNGLFGAGGGMILVPLLTLLTNLDDKSIFPASVAIILPICAISLIITLQPDVIPWHTALPYLIGSAVGGFAAGLISKKLPTIWLHRILGSLIIWGGIQYIC